MCIHRLHYYSIRNGFTVDDGPFRDAAAPENVFFIKCLEQGKVPPGMMMTYIHIGMIMTYIHIGIIRTYT